MAHFTFDTAYIVAHMQNDQNEILKEAIRDRLCEMKYFADEQARCAFSNFETYCWAWQNDCLAVGPLSWGMVRERPPVNCYPYKPDSLDQDVYDMLGEDDAWYRHAGGTA
jgi:hypothetical protein